MGYKRKSKKTGANSYRTQTINNSNGSITNSNSQGSKTFRTTYSNNSKTGNKITQTWKDGAGFTHRKTVYSSVGAERERKRQQQKSAKFWASLFKTNKKRSTKQRTTRTSTTPRETQPGSQPRKSSSTGFLMLVGLFFFTILYLKLA